MYGTGVKKDKGLVGLSNTKEHSTEKQHKKQYSYTVATMFYTVVKVSSHFLEGNSRKLILI